MAPLAKALVSFFLFSSLTLATPLQSQKAHAVRAPECDSPSQGGGSNTNGTKPPKYVETFPSEIHYIYPHYPDRSGLADGIHIEAWENDSQTEQISVFKLPAGAKNCKLDLKYKTKLDRIFLVRPMPGGDSSTITDVRQISEIRRPVTHRNMQPLLDVNKKYSAMREWLGWDQAGKFSNGPALDTFGNPVGPVNVRAPHSGEPIECAEEIYMWERMRDPNNEKALYLKGNNENGWYVNYDIEE